MVRPMSCPSARSSDQAATYHALRRYVALIIFFLLSASPASSSVARVIEQPPRVELSVERSLPVKAGFAIEPTHRVPAQVGKGAGGNAECNKHLCLRHRAHAEDRGADVKKRVGTAR